MLTVIIALRPMPSLSDPCDRFCGFTGNFTVNQQQNTNSHKYYRQVFKTDHQLDERTPDEVRTDTIVLYRYDSNPGKASAGLILAN